MNVAGTGKIMAWRKGDAITAERLNALVDALNAFGRVKRLSASARSGVRSGTRERRPFAVSALVSGGVLRVVVAPGAWIGNGADPRKTFLYDEKTLELSPTEKWRIALAVPPPADGEEISWANDSLEKQSLRKITDQPWIEAVRDGAQDDPDGVVHVPIARVVVLAGKKVQIEQYLHSDFFYFPALMSRIAYIPGANETAPL